MTEIPVPAPVLPNAGAAAGWRCAVPGLDLLGETPLWCEATQSLLWLDVDQARLQRWHPASGRHDVYRFAAHAARFAGSLALCRTPGRVLLALDLALHLFDLGSGELQRLAQVEPAELDNRLNDGRCDAQGRFWVGTMDNGLARPSGGCYRIDPDGGVERLFGDVVVANGIAFAPDGGTMWFSDTRAFSTWAFDVDAAAGRLAKRRLFADYRATRDRPDGACVDAEGGVWTALFGGARIRRYTPDGRLDREIPVPVSNPTCLCLGGPDLRTLYLSTARKFLSPEQLTAQPLAGSVLALQVDVPGLPEARFAR